MTASKETVIRVLEIVLKHVEPRVARSILLELKGVPGNKSFRDTVVSLYNELAQRPRLPIQENEK